MNFRRCQLGDVYFNIELQKSYTGGLLNIPTLVRSPTVRITGHSRHLCQRIPLPRLGILHNIAPLRLGHPRLRITHEPKPLQSRLKYTSQGWDTSRHDTEVGFDGGPHVDWGGGPCEVDIVAIGSDSNDLGDDGAAGDDTETHEHADDDAIAEGAPNFENTEYGKKGVDYVGDEEDALASLVYVRRFSEIVNILDTTMTQFRIYLVSRHWLRGMDRSQIARVGRQWR